MTFWCRNCGSEFNEAYYHRIAGDVPCCPRCGSALIQPAEFDRTTERESEVQPMARNEAFEACKNPQARYWWNGWLVGMICGLALAIVSVRVVWWIGQVWELGL